MLSSGGKLTIFPNALLSVLQMLWGLRAPGKKEEEEEMEEEECYSSCSRSKQNDWSPDLNVMWKADATGWSKRASDIGTKRDGNCRSGGFTGGGGGGVVERAEVRAHKWTHAHTHAHTKKTQTPANALPQKRVLSQPTGFISQPICSFCLAVPTYCFMKSMYSNARKFSWRGGSYMLSWKAQKDSTFYKANPCFTMSVLQRSQLYPWTQSKINARDPFSESTFRETLELSTAISLKCP